MRREVELLLEEVLGFIAVTYTTCQIVIVRGSRTEAGAVEVRVGSVVPGSAFVVMDVVDVTVMTGTS